MLQIPKKRHIFWFKNHKSPHNLLAPHLKQSQNFDLDRKKVTENIQTLES